MRAHIMAVFDDGHTETPLAFSHAEMMEHIDRMFTPSKSFPVNISITTIPDSRRVMVNPELL